MTKQCPPTWVPTTQCTCLPTCQCRAESREQRVEGRGQRVEVLVPHVCGGCGSDFFVTPSPKTREHFGFGSR